MTRRIRLSSAQIYLLNELIPLQEIWKTAHAMMCGNISSTGRRRITVAALQRKDVINEYGQVTPEGKQLWMKRTGQTT